VVNKKELQDKEVVKEAVKDFFVKHYVRAKGISTTLKIILDLENYEKVKKIVLKAVNEKIGKEEKKELEIVLSGLKPEVKKKMINNIINGEKLFLEILANEMSKNDPQEFEKLSSILGNLK